MVLQRIKTKELVEWLEANELSLRDSFKKRERPDRAHQNNYLQFYTIDEKSTQIEKEYWNVVVALGSNYTQILETDMEPKPFDVSVNLGRWQRNAENAINILSVKDWLVSWVNHKWASKPTPNLPKDFLFIMTNLCPWITTEGWSQLDRDCANRLLQKSKEDQKYKHVDSLLDYLKKSNYQITLIGHGINDRIRKPLLEYLQSQRGIDWFLYANLTYKTSPKCWDVSESRFKFSNRAICK